MDSARARAISKGNPNIKFIFFIIGNISHGRITHPPRIHTRSHCSRSKDIVKDKGKRAPRSRIYKTCPVADIRSGSGSGIRGEDPNSRDREASFGEGSDWLDNSSQHVQPFQVCRVCEQLSLMADVLILVITIIKKYRHKGLMHLWMEK